VEHAFKAADLLAQAGGFGLVALDLAGTPARVARRVPMAAWFRLRHGVQNTRTALVSLGSQINAHSCSALKIELCRNRVLWQGRSPAKMIRGIGVTAKRIRNHRAEQESFTFRR
jgi:hypothetical protein